MIEEFDDLRIVGSGATLTPATPTSRRIVLLTSSRLVTLDGFAVSIPIVPNPTWVAEANGSSTCTFSNLAITGGGGIRLQRSSSAAITDVTFTDANIGIIVGNACQADIRGVTISLTPTAPGNVGIPSSAAAPHSWKE